MQACASEAVYVRPDCAPALVHALVRSGLHASTVALQPGAMFWHSASAFAAQKEFASGYLSPASDEHATSATTPPQAKTKIVFRIMLWFSPKPSESARVLPLDAGRASGFKRSEDIMKIGLAVVLSVSSIASVAYAQQPTSPARTVVTKEYAERQLEGNQVVTFGDDKLLPSDSDPYGGMIRPPPRVLRIGLIRPRANFVPELLKSVENL